MQQQSENKKQKKVIYLHQKTNQIGKSCFEICTKKGKQGTSLSGKQLTCIQNCQVKQLNAYSFMYDVIMAGGVSRQSDYQIKKMMI